MRPVNIDFPYVEITNKPDCADSSLEGNLPSESITSNSFEKDGITKTEKILEKDENDKNSETNSTSDEDSQFSDEEISDEDVSITSGDSKKVKTEITSEYERRRLENIAELKAKFKERFGDDPLKHVEKCDFPSRSTLRTVSSARRETSSKIILMPRRKSTRIIKSKRKYYFADSDDSGDEKQRAKRNLKRTVQDLKSKIFLRYGDDWPRKNDPTISSDDDDDFFPEDADFKGFKKCGFQGFQDVHKFQKRKIGNWKPRISLNPREIKSPEEITEKDIARIHYKSSAKRYDPIKGTTCHQCRQKTTDTKTVCRDRECSGVRGQFCGFCLKSRYGEDAAEALLNPTWSCPPCRGICNCSICRTRSGKMPTGVLTPLALDKGYDSVRHFLESIDEEKLIKMNL